MSSVNAEIKMQGNNDAFFTTNAAVVYPANIQIFHIDGRYKFTDGVTALSALPFLGEGSGVQSVSGTNVDNTDPLNPIVNEQTTVNGETIETQNNKGQANGYVELDAFNRYLFPAQANPTVKSVIRNINTTPRNYIFPDATGTVALTSDIPSVTGLVPYTGATTDVDLDTYSLNAKSLHVKGTGGAGHLGLKHQSANITASTSESSLGANASGNPVWKNDGNPIQELSFKTTDYTQKFAHTGGTYTLTVAPSFIYSIRTTTMILDESDTNDVIISGNTLTVTNPNFLAGETLYIKYKA